MRQVCGALETWLSETVCVAVPQYAQPTEVPAIKRRKLEPEATRRIRA